MKKVLTEREYIKDVIGRSITTMVIFCGIDIDLNRQISLNIPLARKFSEIKERRRSAKIDHCINEILAENPDKDVLVDIDILMNPSYKVDIICSLVNINKNRKISVIWPGEIKDNQLIYSKEGYDDYKVFSINDYDIVCVMKGV